MASSSDSVAVRGFIPPQDDEERRLMRRVEELCRVALHAVFSAFVISLSMNWMSSSESTVSAMPQ